MTTTTGEPTMSAMQQTQRAENLVRALVFRAILFRDHEPDCECEPEDPAIAQMPLTLHRRKCKILKRGYCTCRPVFVHAPVSD